MSEEYMIGFWAHGEYHEIAIDLECLAKALKLKDKNRRPAVSPKP